jgi:hypothetical protein
MLHEYTPETVGGKLVYLFEKPHSRYGSSKEFYLGDNHVKIMHRAKDGAITVIVMNKGITTKIISSVELNWNERENKGYFYPEEVGTP